MRVLLLHLLALGLRLQPRRLLLVERQPHAPQLLGLLCALLVDTTQLVQKRLGRAQRGDGAVVLGGQRVQPEEHRSHAERDEVPRKDDEECAVVVPGVQRDVRREHRAKHDNRLAQRQVGTTAHEHGVLDKLWKAKGRGDEQYGEARVQAEEQRRRVHEDLGKRPRHGRSTDTAATLSDCKLPREGLNHSNTQNPRPDDGDSMACRRCL